MIYIPHSFFTSLFPVQRTGACSRRERQTKPCTRRCRKSHVPSLQRRPLHRKVSLQRHTHRVGECRYAKSTPNLLLMEHLTRSIDRPRWARRRLARTRDHRPVTRRHLLGEICPSIDASRCVDARIFKQGRPPHPARDQHLGRHPGERPPRTVWDLWPRGEGVCRPRSGDGCRQGLCVC